MSARDELRWWEGLQEQQYWRGMVEAIQSQVSHRTDQVMLMPLEGERNVYSQEFMKGEAAGLRLVLAMIEGHMESLKTDVEAENVQKTTAPDE